ncbi:MAG: hypothetical protein FP825_13240 [Hyphomonas sp.]|uniref:hypothetical protein n=1 Tax=Hyphomonas sp. TaxID=87 RepID=UPI00181DC705|nr:hypothetical protein [Hyphomonas sp.]MBA3069430.1 hypothetical protein [Hyphomonas sp.]MBU3919029.1 hypothetical protein [Alphaproteobacteria bacterium]MBU4063812.1 hypothetical protein [Alphaproteobacteria bacterium]MBU4164227.1 hypothetical protein [Alphaproteobacteria bacterium]
MRPLVTATLLIFAAALPASADAVLAKAQAFSKEGLLYAFDLDVDDGEDQFRLTVDQSKPAGKRVIKFTPDVATLKGAAAKKAEQLIKLTAGDIWCSNFAENIPADAKRVSETQASATYSFTPLPGKADAQSASAYKFLNGSATIDKATGAILAYEMASPKAFKPMAVAKIDKLTMKVACKPLPDGRTYIDSFTFDLKGSAMMQSINQKEFRKISNLTPLPQSGFGTR